MLLSAAGVAFTPTLRPHVAQQTARAAVVCGLEAPVPPAAVVVLEAATHQVCTIQPITALDGSPSPLPSRGAQA